MCISKIATIESHVRALTILTEDLDRQRLSLRSYRMPASSHRLGAKLQNHHSGAWGHARSTSFLHTPRKSQQVFASWNLSRRDMQLIWATTLKHNSVLHNRLHCQFSVSVGFKSFRDQVLCTCSCRNILTTMISWRSSISIADHASVMQQEKVKFQLRVLKVGSLHE